MTVKELIPPEPASLDLADETFVVCPHEKPDQFICMAPQDARKVVQNKVKINTYIAQTNAQAAYFRRRLSPSSVK